MLLSVRPHAYIESQVKILATSKEWRIKFVSKKKAIWTSHAGCKQFLFLIIYNDERPFLGGAIGETQESKAGLEWSDAKVRGRSGEPTAIICGFCPQPFWCERIISIAVTCCDYDRHLPSCKFGHGTYHLHPCTSIYDHWIHDLFATVYIRLSCVTTSSSSFEC